MMKQHTITRVIGLALLISLLLFSPVGARHASANTGRSSSPHCGGWTIVPSPNPTTYQNQLYAVAAVSPTDVWAVGDDQTGTLIEHWDGSTWTVVPGANPQQGGLDGVVALSASNVWAVGASGTPLIEHWNGSNWQGVASPPVVEGGFSGIAALSASDIWAVGGQLKGGPLTEHWDGTSWQVVPAPGVPDHSNQFNAVSVLSPTDVWAVGSSTAHGAHAGPTPLIEHWNGSAWQMVSSPNVGKFSSLNGVAALSSNNVWAVGIFVNGNLNEHWDGQRWHVISPALNGFTNSVTAVSASNVWAVGSTEVNYAFDTFIEQWNGSQWQQVPSPNMTANTLGSSYDNDLLGVSASSAHDIWAVGYDDLEYGNASYTLIEHYC